MSEHEKATPRPWKVEPGFGQVWTVIGPGDVAIGENFCLREDAEHIAGYLNDAYEAGYDASRALIEQMRDALREMFAEAVEYRSQSDEEMYNQCDADICGVLTPIGMALPHVPECPFSKGRAAIAAAEKFLKEGQ